MDALAPYEPDRTLPWNAARAAFVLRRAGFAPSPEEVDRALSDGVGVTIERLLDDDESARALELDALGERIALARDIGSLRAWWLLRQRFTTRPLRARMAVLWHDHFATSNVKVDDPSLMLRQLRTIERHGTGRFRDLVGAIAVDPAMIIWLDGEDNIKGRPNENFARELFELFMLGLGAYDERDIREAARAFTGWRVRQGRSEFTARLHDDRVKSVLGVRGDLSGQDVIDIAMAQAATSRFVARKLLSAFLTPMPEAALVEALARQLRETEFDLASAACTVLRSRALHDPRHARTLVKSPVEFVIGLVRAFDLRATGPELAESTDRLGQRLFDPPSVEGWEGGRAWLTSTTMLLRLNTIATALDPDRLDAGRLASRVQAADPGALVPRLGDLVLDGSVPTAIEGDLEALTGDPDVRVREALRLMLSSPEFQLS